MKQGQQHKRKWYRHTQLHAVPGKYAVYSDGDGHYAVIADGETVPVLESIACDFCYMKAGDLNRAEQDSSTQGGRI